MSDPGSRPYQPQRSATRAPIGRPVRMQFDDSTDVEDGTCQNISIGGMFISLEQPRSDGKLVRFELVLDDRQSVRGLGEVIWLRPGAGEDGRTGMGVKFRFLEQRDRQMIFKLVSQHIKDRLSARDPSPLPAMDPGLAARVARARPDAPPSVPDQAPVEPHVPNLSPASVPAPLPDVAAEDPGDGSRSAASADPTPLADAPPADAPPADAPPADAPPADARPARADETTEPIEDPASQAAEAAPSAAPAEAEAAPEPGATVVAEGEPEIRPSGGLFDVDRPVSPIDGPVTAAETARDYRLSDEENVDDEALERPPVAEPATRRSSSFSLVTTVAVVLLVAAAVVYFMRGRLFSDLRGTPVSPAAEAVGEAGDPADPVTTSPTSSPETTGEDISTPAVDEADEPTDSPAEGGGTSPASAEPSAPQAEDGTASPVDGGADELVDAAPPEEPAGAVTRGGQVFDRVLDIDARPVEGGLDVEVVTNGIVPPDRVRHFRLDGDDPREVVQLIGARRFGRTRVDIAHPLIDDIRIGFHRKRDADELHVVVDLAGSAGRVRAVRNLGRQLVIEIR